MLASHELSIPSGWTFDHWVMTGGVSLVGENIADISGDGTLKAVFTQLSINLIGVTVVSGEIPAQEPKEQQQQ
jgi:hypothetical protein